MIYLETGQPGHGKTLRAMQLALEFQAKGREVYVHGVRGLKAAEAGFHVLEDPRKWQELPDGSVVVLDECYSVFPRRGPGAKVPDYVQALATHRHRGFDFILICQQAKQQIDIFLLGLVESHEHIRRRFGLKKSVILWWDKFNENPVDSNIKRIWSFPKDVMARNLYESTVQDTTERRIPWYLWALPLTVVLLVLVVWRVMAFFSVPKDQPVSGRSKASVSAMSLSGGEARPDDIASWLRPRVAGQPWTARAYDGRAVVSEPEVYCIAVDTGDCKCITEQGTRYVVQPALCRSLAANGSYNPTRRPARDQDDQQRPAEQQQEDPVQAVSNDAVGTSSGWPGGVGRASYVPPGAPGSWNPDAFGSGR